MSKVKSVMAAALTLAVVGSAVHAADFTVTTSPVVSLGSGLSSVTVYLNFTDVTVTGLDGGVGGANVSKFTFATGTGTFNIVPVYDDSQDVQNANTTGPADVFTYPAALGAYDGAGTLLTTSDSSKDTHFTFLVGMTGLDGADPTESDDIAAANVVTVDVSGYTKTTTQLSFKGGTALAPSLLAYTSEALTEPLAQLVFPSSATGPISYTLYDLSGTPVSGTIATSAVTTPEPASLGLLALGGVALLTRRKNVK
jgi:hypothetical protein